jgi:hypothetical protein
LGRNCLLEPDVEGKIEGGIETTGRSGRRYTQLLDNRKEKRGYWILKEGALDRTIWRIRCARGCGPVVMQNTERFFCPAVILTATEVTHHSFFDTKRM